MCSEVDTKRSEQGLVFKCMIGNYTSLSEGCQRELGRSVHMAFFIWAANGVITAPCDSDVNNYCLDKGNNIQLAKQPGAVGTCLAQILEAQAEVVASPARKLLQEEGPEKKDDDKEDAEKAAEKAKEEEEERKEKEEKKAKKEAKKKEKEEKKAKKAAGRGRWRGHCARCAEQWKHAAGGCCFVHALPMAAPAMVRAIVGPYMILPVLTRPWGPQR